MCLLVFEWVVTLSLGLSFLSCPFTVPLRAPELSLTSRSPTDIQVSWQPLPAKLSRGKVSAYRLSYRTSAESTFSQMELPGEKTQHLLENLQPDTIYLLRITAATSIGWGEQSAWTSHRTPKASSARGTTQRRIVKQQDATTNMTSKCFTPPIRLLSAGTLKRSLFTEFPSSV